MALSIVHETWHLKASCRGPESALFFPPSVAERRDDARGARGEGQDDLRGVSRATRVPRVRVARARTARHLGRLDRGRASAPASRRLNAAGAPCARKVLLAPVRARVLARAIAAVLARVSRVAVSRGRYVPPMARDPRPAVVFLRMSPQLREGLRHAADRAGCSLNAFAVQILATAAGDPARFRAQSSHEESETAAARSSATRLGIRSNGSSGGDTPSPATSSSARWASSWARKRLDAEDPGYFVEWLRLRTDEREARESADRRGAA